MVFEKDIFDNIKIALKIIDIVSTYLILMCLLVLF